jgi:hypothetical protein
MKKLIASLALIAISGTTVFAQTTSKAANKAPNISGWPTASQNAANEMIKKYGNPHESTASMLVWYNNGPWAKTVVYNHEVAHNFPKPHTDVLQQWVGMAVTEGKVDNIFQFDGSIIVDRTAGMIGVKCDKEAANFMAANLAYDLANGNMSVINARDYMTKATEAMDKTGEMDPYMKGLNFKNNANLGDKDQVTVGK